ncbi:uncharacterized protein LOC133326981, partial [Musca vetustissima]|uniref:uncharacterized protein LOC133326981 n=1 Tax=Musca vetustissima TaxID=27455 RepID=UPI002AB6480F
MRHSPRTSTFIWIIFLNNLQWNIAAKVKTKVVLFHNATTFHNPDYFNRYDVSFSEDHQSMDCDSMLIRNITEPLWDKFSVEMKLKKDNNYRVLVTYIFNVCDILGKSFKESTNLFGLWAQNMLKYGNLPKSCPILA